MELVRTNSEWFAVDEPSGSGAVRRAAIRLAGSLGFGDERIAQVGIVSSEIATNVCRHGSGGTVALQVALRAGTPGVRIVAMDRGPGMSDLAVSVVDGHSTTGTLGLGLGAITRLSSCLDVSSHPGFGTVLVADLWPGEVPDTHSDVAGLCRAMPGQEVCGDGVGAIEIDGRLILMVADGLGHGSLAATASSQALRVLADTAAATATAGPEVVLAAANRALAQTRGAAVAVAVLDHGTGRVRFAGVGNISAAVDDGVRKRALLSHPGIVGSRMPMVRAQDEHIPPGAVLVMHSDGIRENWSLAQTPGLSRRGSAVIAASVLRDAAGRPDDASVLVARAAA